MRNRLKALARIVAAKARADEARLAAAAQEAAAQARRIAATKAELSELAGPSALEAPLVAAGSFRARAARLRDLQSQGAAIEAERAKRADALRRSLARDRVLSALLKDV